ncbi:hypothetical protein BJ508DRAFT_111971 [Ascobolus immersus RN42]|uniref:Uncharacterized protein n=1 Tax=Ascobolus immersus RN42 TaxID=1160509 RepID=A0A3N4H871_ASCIM|nr:hypothetical protein BJ508DRAFT_111971 [Ascobolus immersus RN42]
MMAPQETICGECGMDFFTISDKQGGYIRRCYCSRVEVPIYRFKGTAANRTIINCRSVDGFFYCPIKNCGFRNSEKTLIISHCEATFSLSDEYHPVLPTLKPGVKKVSGSSYLEYDPDTVSLARSKSIQASTEASSTVITAANTGSSALGQSPAAHKVPTSIDAASGSLSEDHVNSASSVNQENAANLSPTTQSDSPKASEVSPGNSQEAKLPAHGTKATHRATNEPIQSSTCPELPSTGLAPLTASEATAISSNDRSSSPTSTKAPGTLNSSSSFTSAPSNKSATSDPPNDYTQSSAHPAMTEEASGSGSTYSAPPENLRPDNRPEPTADDELIPSLRAEYRRKVHAEMMRTMKDPDADYRESMARRELFKAWFEEGIEMLKEMEKDV